MNIVANGANMKDVARIAKTAVATVALLLACQVNAQGAQLAEARQLYDEGRWAAAWDQFATLADRGDVEAARMAIRMTRYGAQLFNQAWAPQPERMARWRVVATGEPPVRTAGSD
jgi:hypothetical protein